VTAQLENSDNLSLGKEAAEGDIHKTKLVKEGIRNFDKQLEEEDFMDYISDQSKNLDMENDCQGWQSPKSKKSKKKNMRQLMVATRTSSRVPRDGIPIATKAANRAKAKNTITGTITTTNPFTVLNNASTAFLEKVIIDLDIEVENVEEQIDIFRAEELARAAIAKANYEAFLEK